MSLFLITGVAGTGKSEVCRVLKANSYEAIDTDDDGLARWQHTQTGYIHPKSSIKPEQRTPDFLAHHAWVVPRQYVEELAQKAINKPVFLCGSLTNEDELRDLFQKVFVLFIDEDTLKHRLTTRTNNNWGKQPHELQQTLDHHSKAYEQYRQKGDVIIDATQPVDEVAASILRNVNATDQ